MDGLNFVNPSVQVEAVAFAPWQSHWLGVMVTPWFINLMLLPRDVSAWTSIPQGKTLRYHFPAGDYEFISSHDQAVGEPDVLADLAAARLCRPRDRARSRRTARDALLDPANAPVPDIADEDSDPGPLARIKEQARAPMSKRDFLRGRFLREDSDAARG